MIPPPPNHFAGFFNPALRQGLEKKFGEYQTKALLRQLSLFRVESNIPQERALNVPSEVAVLHNMLIRGLPTIPSLFVEESERGRLERGRRGLSADFRGFFIRGRGAERDGWERG